MTTPMLANSRTNTRSNYNIGFRSDLQGIRGLAVLLVLFYHAQIPLFSGGFVGVDVFFVLSGFLITGIVAREIQGTGRFSLSRFYGRRIVRIVPAATVLLLFVVVASYLWLPLTRWREIATEVVGSALYFSNWQFAASADYLNAEAAPSPIQHFWSLAIEEQYYLLWPALLLLGVFLLSRRRIGNQSQELATQIIHLAVALMSVITLASFAFSLYAMAHWPAVAYFITPTRLWELGIGSLLALAAPHLRSLSTSVKWMLVVGGVLAILTAGILYDRSTPFPGATALLPVLGTAAAITGGLPTNAGARLRTFLDFAPLVWIGDISYSLYLWHWPLIVIAEGVFGPQEPTTLILVAALAVVPAYASTRFIEKPLLKRPRLRSSPSRAFILGTIAIFISIISAIGLLAAVTNQGKSGSPSESVPQGANSLGVNELPPQTLNVPDHLTPPLVDAADDNARIYSDGCHLEFAPTEPKVCEYGNSTGPLVLLTGDSHAAQWFPLLEELAQRNGYRLISMTKSSCPYVSIPIQLAAEERTYSECTTWNENVRSYVLNNHPALVVTSSLTSYTPADGDSNDASMSHGLREAWSWTSSQGSAVLVLADTPYMSSNVPECLAQHLNDPGECRTSRKDALARDGLESHSADGLTSVTVVDLNSKICPGMMCEPIIGDVLVYRDQHHLSATYARTLLPYFEQEAAKVLSTITE